MRKLCTWLGETLFQWRKKKGYSFQSVKITKKQKNQDDFSRSVKMQSSISFMTTYLDESEYSET